MTGSEQGRKEWTGALKVFGVVAAGALVVNVASSLLARSIPVLAFVAVFATFVLIVSVVGAVVCGIVVLVNRERPPRPSTTSPMGLLAGWYPDQVDPDLLRYFDGQLWTSGTAPREA
jgi:hypothetical protein